MKIKTSLVRSLTLAAGLCAASNIVNAAPANFSDSWKQVASLDTANGTYTNKTTGSFSVAISVPGVVSSNFDIHTVVSLELWDGLAAAPVQVFDNQLGDDQNYVNGAKSATFPIIVNEKTNGSVTVSWTATTVTVRGSSASDLLSEAANYSSTVKSNFNVGSISLTVDSTANPNGHGAVFTYAPDEVPVAGNNTTTQEAKTNIDGSMTPMEAGSISAVTDFTLPKLSIAFPGNNYHMNAADPIIAMHGSASDYYGITTVEYYLNDGAAIPVDNSPPTVVPTLAWKANVDMSAVGLLGTNKITVFAINSLGLSNGITETIVVVSNSPVVIQVSPVGSGTVSGLKSNQMVQMQNKYPVTATPASQKWIFSQWTDGTGTVLSTSPSFGYLANTGNNTLVAVFKANPFYGTGLAGNYQGLYETDTVTSTNAGYINLTVTPNGTYTGKIYLPETQTAYAISGQLALPAGSEVATADSKVKVGKLFDLDVALTFAINPDLTADGAGVLGGLVSASTEVTNALWAAAIQGMLALDSPSVQPGLYNVVVSPSGDPAAGPGGYSFASVTVTKTGTVTIVMNLADGTTPVTTFSTSIGLGGVCPVYAPLYGGNGVILGALRFSTGAVANDGPINWQKFPVKDKFYTNGFSLAATASGGFYEPLNIFDWTTNGVFVVNDTAVAVTFNPVKNTIVDPIKRDKVSVSLAPSTGALSGSFGAATFFTPPTNTVAAPTFKGVVTSDAGWGFYSATNQVPGTGMETGWVLIQADPPPAPAEAGFGSFSLISVQP